MKVSEYNQMMAYLLRPRQKFAIGGGVVEGEDLGSREGFRKPAMQFDPKMQKQVSDLLDKGLSTPEIADELETSTNTIIRIRKEIGREGVSGAPKKDLYNLLNKDGEFEKFFKEYLEKESKMEVGGKARQSKLWPIVKEALKNVPKNASIEEKFNAVINFDKPAADYGYKSKTVKGKTYSRRIGDTLYSAISDSFKKYEKNLGKMSLKNFSDKVPAYSYTNLQSIFNLSEKNPDLIKGEDKKSRNKKSEIVNAKRVVNEIKKSGVKITKERGAGSPYLFEGLTDDVVANLKNIKALQTTDKDFDRRKLRNLIEMFSRASEDYQKFGFSKMATTLNNSAAALNKALINEFTSKVYAGPESKRTISSLNDAMSKDDVINLRKFIDNNPKIKNVLSITFDPSGKNGTYFKPRNLDNLSGGQLLKDILIEKDHIFPLSEVSVLKPPEKGFMGEFGPGGALSETPYNKVLSTNYFNNSLRNNMQNFLNVNSDNKDAIRQINNTLQGLDTTIYHNGKYYGGKITPSIQKQINKLGYDKFDIEKDVVNNIKEQDVEIKKLKKAKFSDSAIVKAVKNSKYAFPFVIGAPFVLRPTSSEAAEVAPGTEQLRSARESFKRTDEEGFSDTEKLLAGTTAGSALFAARKPILKTLGKVARPFGFPSVAAGFALKELTSEDPNLGVVGADLLLPELTKQAGIRGIFANPFQLAEKARRFGKIGRGIASLARVPAMFTPVGLTLMAAEGIMMGMEEQERLDRMRIEDPEQYEEIQAFERSLLEESA